MEGFDGTYRVCDTEKKFLHLLSELQKAWNEHHYILGKFLVGKQRSSLQNNSLHLYLVWLSAALNERGLDMRTVLKPEIDIPWDKDGRMAKEHLWRPVQMLMFDKESTTEPLRQHYPEIYDVLNRHMINKFGVSVPWPKKKD